MSRLQRAALCLSLLQLCEQILEALRMLRLSAPILVWAQVRQRVVEAPPTDAEQSGSVGKRRSLHTALAPLQLFPLPLQPQHALHSLLLPRLPRQQVPPARLYAIHQPLLLPLELLQLLLRGYQLLLLLQHAPHHRSLHAAHLHHELHPLNHR
eukprot:504813-Rhodomonas_salina.1